MHSAPIFNTDPTAMVKMQSSATIYSMGIIQTSIFNLISTMVCFMWSGHHWDWWLNNNNSINTGYWEVTQLLAPQVIIYMSKDAKSHKNVESEEGIIISGPQSLLEQIQWLLPKMGQLKPCRNMIYCISPGPVFHVDSGSEVRIPIFCLWHLIWPTLCESTP